jgi:acetyl-CoA carboxylase biotin carboxyl carrier protein
MPKSPKKTIKKTGIARKKGPVKKSKEKPQATPLTMQQVKEAIALLKDAKNFSTFRYRTPEFEIEIELQRNTQIKSDASFAPPPTSDRNDEREKKAATDSSAPKNKSSNYTEILSPMVGTFYRRPNPTSAPFVEVGSVVEPDTSVCIVEVMKLLTTIPAGCKGKVREICVEDGVSIETGQLLMRIEPI